MEKRSQGILLEGYYRPHRRKNITFVVKNAVQTTSKADRARQIFTLSIKGLREISKEVLSKKARLAI